MASVCIVCQKPISGKAVKVKDDKIISAIRAVKNVLKVAQNNQLYVCNADLPEYTKRRKKFERDLVVFGAIAIVIILLLTGLPLLSGRFDIRVFIISILMGALVFLFGALFKYVPAVESRS